MSKFLTTAEQAVRADTEAQLAAGGDPFGDDEEIVAPSIAEQAATAQAKVDKANGVAPADADPAADIDEGADAGLNVEAEADAVVEPVVAAAVEPVVAAEPATPAQRPPQFRVASQEAIDADTAALNLEKATALKKMMDGDLEPEAYAAIDASVTHKLGRLLVQSALAEANAQNAAQAENTALVSLMNASKRDGTLDYNTDLKAQKQFDMALDMLQADPDNANRGYVDLINEAHSAVLSLRGIAKAKAPAAAVVADKPPARVPGAAPVTLRGLPQASTPNTGGTIADAMGRLQGAEYQAAYAKLSPAQKAALVDD